MELRKTFGSHPKLLGIPTNIISHSKHISTLNNQPEPHSAEGINIRRKYETINHKVGRYTD